MALINGTNYDHIDLQAAAGGNVTRHKLQDTDGRSLVASTEASSTASAAHAVGSYFIFDGALYRATADIAQGGTIVTSGNGKNCEALQDGLGGDVSNLKSALDYKASINLYKNNLIVGAEIHWNKYKANGTGANNNYSYVVIPVTTGTTYYIYGKLRYLAKATELLFNWGTGQINYVYTSDFTGDLYITFFNEVPDWVVSLTENIDNIPGYNTMPLCKSSILQEAGNSQRLPMSQKAVAENIKDELTNYISDKLNLLFSAKQRVQGKYYATASGVTDKRYDYFVVEVTSGTTYYFPNGFRFLVKNGNTRIEGEILTAYTYTADFTGDLYITFDHEYPGWIMTTESNFERIRPYDVPSLFKKALKQSTGTSEYYPMSQKAVSDAIEGVKGILHGKKWVACGDSFTHGDFANAPSDNYHITSGRYAGQLKVYPYIIGNRCDMTIVNEAISGSTMTYVDGTKSEFSTSNGRYTKIPADADYITLWFGINDYNQRVPIGNIDDTANTTFYGAWNTVLLWLIENRPSAKIGIVITNGSMKNGLQTAYTEAEIAIAKKYGIPYLNLALSDQIPYFLRQWERTDVAEAVKTARDAHFEVGSGNHHPSAEAHEFESTFIEEWLKTL